MVSKDKRSLLLTGSNSPLTESQAEWVNHLMQSLTAEQYVWLSGFFTALSFQQNVGMAELQSVSSQVSRPFPITVLFASETGTSRNIASQLSQDLIADHWEVHLVDAKDYKTAKFKSERCILVVTATHGDGDPPEPAKKWYDFIMSDRAPSCENLVYAVLALGDSSYEHFCQCGVDIDKRLLELGAKPLCARQDCDLDYEKSCLVWRNELDKALAAFLPDSTLLQAPPTEQKNSIPLYTKQNPFQAKILEKINLCDVGTSKTTYHLELSLEGSQINYKPGDCLGVHPTNNPSEVDSILTLLNLNGDLLIQIADHSLSLREALLREVELSRITLPVFTGLIESATKINAGINDKKQVQEYLKGKSLLHVLHDLGIRNMDAQQLVDKLRRMPHRLYSIASSLLARPDEAHLLVTLAEIQLMNEHRLGVFSNECDRELSPGDSIPVYLHENQMFKLRYDALDKPIIMIGPGTGLAPFRAFMEEREEMGVTGLSWLFFGECKMYSDFYYQTEWQQRLSNGTLSRMNVAFSRDQANKIYVQHRMKEQQKALFDWIDSKGAIVYVCGDADKMTKDVYQALLEIVSTQKKCSIDLATEYVEHLVETNRYLRDVY